MQRDPEIQLLLDKQACTEVIYRLARAIDRCDADQLAQCFHKDATDDHGIFKGTASDFVTFVMPMLAGMIRTQHTICNVLVEVKGDDARSESYFVAQHTLHGESGTQTEMFAAGRYLDTFSRRDGVWRLQHRHAVYDWNTAEAATSGWESEPMKSKLQRGMRGQADPSYAHFTALKDAPG
ncbi:MAG: nuclear transport factor 2 family protein [Caulobacterales bacterium]|jgi:ketosteroid isomerase-like protein